MNHNFSIFRAKCQLRLRKALHALSLAAFFFLPARGQLNSLTEKITLDLRETTAKRIIEEADRQSSHAFLFAPEILDRVNIRHFTVKEQPLGRVLELLQQKHGLLFSVSDGNIYVRQGQADTQAPVQEKESGSLRGKIIDEENGQPIIGATVRIGATGTTTNENGQFSIRLPAGRYTAVLSSIGYGPKEIGGVEIRSNQVFTLNATLKQKKGNLATVVVRSSARREGVNALYSRQKNAGTVTDGISAEQIARTPDNNMGQALKRISGVTTVDNKYVIVRGLSERYNQAMLDGIVIPSTSMNKRNFSFDIIPTEMVSNVVVNKTATPDMSSEFSGGQVSVNTLDIPSESFTTITIGTGWNSQTTGKDFYRLGKLGTGQYLGFDNPGNKLPDNMKAWYWHNNVNVPPPGIPGQTDDLPLIPEEGSAPYSSLDAVAQSKRISADALKLQRYKGRPNQQYRISLGRVYDLKRNARIGFVAGLHLRNEQNIVDFNNVRGAEDSKNFMDSTGYAANGPGRSYRFNSTSGAIANIGFQNDRLRLGLKNMYTRVYNDFYNESERLVYGDLSTSLPMIRQQYQLPESMSLRQHKLEVSYQVAPKYQLDASASVNFIEQRIVDERKLQHRATALLDGKHYFHTPNLYLASSAGVSNNVRSDSRMWTNVDETDYNWASSLTRSFGKSGVFSTQVKAGYMGWHKHRKASVFRMLPMTAGKTLIETPYDVILSEDRIGAGEGQAFYWAENINGPIFDGAMSNHAFYAMADQKLRDKLRLVYGLRAEYYNLSNRQEDYIKRRFGSIPGYLKLFSTTGEKDWRLLPSVNLIYSLTPQMNIRASYSRTAIRPDFRETSYFGFYDPELDANISGRQLVSTLVDNIDLRYEWYPGPGEIISVSAFYKYMDKPTELVANSQLSGQYAFQNQHSAVNQGLELEIRKSFGFLPGKKWLQDLFIFGNGTLVKSKVEVMSFPIVEMVDGEEVTISKRLPGQSRPLLGQSPWILNAGLAYWGESFGATASYSQRGYRTNIPADVPNAVEYEIAPRGLDFQLYLRFFKKAAELKLNAANLLNEWNIYYTNARAYEQDPADGSKWLRVRGNDDYNKQDGDVIKFRSRSGRRFSMSLTYNF